MGGTGDIEEGVETIQLSWIPHVHTRCGDPKRPRSKSAKPRAAATKAPEPVLDRCAEKAAEEWTVVEDLLEKKSRGHYNPRLMRHRRRPRAPRVTGPSTLAEAEYSRRPGVQNLGNGRLAPCGRVSVVTPTTDRRHDFHEQLWQVFDAQDWPDKELIIIETHQNRPSPFFTAKMMQDDRIVFHSMMIPAGQEDLSIGLKRNMGIHLASGDWIASFDDDDLYAPSYLATMLEEMVRQEAAAITLGSWYIFEEHSGMFGYVDCRDSGDQKTDFLGRVRPQEREGWLYGFGFSYIFSQDYAVDYPFPDKNMGEDYDFFMRLKTRIQVALLYDDFGICVHTLHPRSTSSVQTDKEVPREEIYDLDVVQLGAVLAKYVARFPRQGLSTNIKSTKRRIERPLAVTLVQFQLEVNMTRSSRCTIPQVRDQLAKRLGLSPKSLALYDNEECTGKGLADDFYLGVRAQKLWAKQPPEVAQAGDDCARGAKVVSAGFNDGNKCEFYLGSRKIPFKTIRGMNVVSINPATWAPSSCCCFDSWGDPEACGRLIAHLDSIQSGHFVLMGIKDSGLEKLSPQVRAAMQSVGSNIQGGSMREGFAMISIKGGQGPDGKGRGQLLAESQGPSVSAVAILRRASAMASLEKVSVTVVDVVDEEVVVTVQVPHAVMMSGLREALIQQHLEEASAAQLRGLKLATASGHGTYLSVDTNAPLGESRSLMAVGLAACLGLA